MNKFMDNLDKNNEPNESNEQNKLSIYKKVVADFFEKNRSLVFLLPLLVVMIVILIVLYTGDGKAPASTVNNSITQNTNNNSSLLNSVGNNTDTASSNKVEVLPQTERAADDDKESEREDKRGTVPVNPFELPMKLSGVIVNSDKDSVAIIETSIKSYVVREGELVNDIWKVSKIEEKGVLLINGDEEKYLTIQK